MTRWLFKMEQREFVVYARTARDACVRFGIWRWHFHRGTEHEFVGAIE